MFLLFAVVLFHKSMLPIGEIKMHYIKYRTGFSVFNCRYSVFFGITNTDIGIGIGF